MNQITAQSSIEKQMENFPFFKLEKNPQNRTAILYLNKPDKRNAMDMSFWRDLPHVIRLIETDPEIRCAVIAGSGKSFTTGLDLGEFIADSRQIIQGETGDRRTELYNLILGMQTGLNEIANGRKIYIAAVQKHCIGGGLDLIAACDLRLASKDAQFSLRETRVAIVADMGSLNRLPAIIGEGNTALMAYTGRDFSAEEALRMGLVSEIFETQETLLAGARALAEEIAANPTLAVQGSKEIIRYGRSHGPDDGLKYVAAWNAAFLDSADLRELSSAVLEKRRPVFG